MHDPGPGAALTAEHHEIDAGVVPAAAGAGDAATLGAALRLLRAHIHAEETVLFPPLVEAENLAMPVFVMQREHGQMWPLIARLEAACAAGASAAALQDDAAVLLRLLNMHNPKEEQIVYAAADRHVAARPGATLGADLAAARMPPGWRCKTAPPPAAS